MCVYICMYVSLYIYICMCVAIATNAFWRICITSFRNSMQASPHDLPCRLGDTTAFPNEFSLSAFAVYLAQNVSANRADAKVALSRDYLKSAALGMNRLWAVTQRHPSWAASSLCKLGAQVGPAGKIRRVSSNVKKEVIELAADIKGQGLTKPRQMLLGFSAVSNGGAMKRPRTLDACADACGSQPSEAACGFQPSEGSEPSAKRICFKHSSGTQAEIHYAYNYHLSTRRYHVTVNTL